MGKVKLIIHESYHAKRKMEDVFVAVFQSNAAAVTEHDKASIIKSTNQSQDSLCSGIEENQ